MTVKRTGGEAHELLDDPFTEPRLIAVEGRHDQAFFSALIEHMELDSFQVHSLGGKSSWRKKILAIGRNDSFVDNVRRIGMVRDADNDGTASWTSCVDAVSELGFAPPTEPHELSEERDGKSFAVMVTPQRSATGALEDLLMPALDTQRLACIDEMYECLTQKEITFKGGPKERIQVYYGTFDISVRDTTVAIGKSLIDLAHPAFDTTKRFIRSLASE